MTPRNQLSTSAYAYNAETLDGLDSASFAQLANTNTFTGTNLFKPSSDSTTAFRIQNAAGSNLLGVDSTNAGGVTLLGNNSGEPASWQTASNALPAGLSDFTAVTANGYVYAIGGGTGVYYAKLNADGSVGSWTTSSNSLPSSRTAATAVVANGYIYVMGGILSGTGPMDTVYYAKLAADGSVGSWSTSSSTLPDLRSDATSVYANGYLYVIGGFKDAVQQSVFYAKVNADGSVGSWTTEATNILPTSGRYRATSVYANGYVYVMGGPFGGADVSYARLNTNGSVGTWTNIVGSLPAVREDATSVVSNGYVYVIGGSADSGTSGNSTVYYAKLNADGTLGSWSTAANGLPAARCRSASIIANGYAYVMGGNPGSSSDCGNTTNATSVYYSRVGGVVQIGGNLDLVGLQGQTLADGGSGSVGSTGGSITAGNITGVGTLQIQGMAAFADSVAISGALAVSSDVSIQNALGASLFVADTTNTVVKIGNPGSATLTDVRLLTSNAEFTGTVRIGNTTDGVEFSATAAPLFRGAARPTWTTSLVPEYSGATFTGDGTNNNGSLSSDFCSGSSRLNINATACAATESNNYYQWTTTQGTAQDYDVYVRYRMPSNYSSGSMTNLSIDGWGTTTASEQVVLTFYSSGSATPCATLSNAVTSNATWGTATSASPLGSCSIAADDVVTFKVHVVAGQNNYARAGKISFTYRSVF